MNSARSSWFNLTRSTPWWSAANLVAASLGSSSRRRIGTDNGLRTICARSIKSIKWDEKAVPARPRASNLIYLTHLGPAGALFV